MGAPAVAKSTKANVAVDFNKLRWAMTTRVQVGAEEACMFENGGARFAQFKAASDAVLGKHVSATARPKEIDWAHYKAVLPKQAAWVNSMEKQFKEVDIPKPNDVLSKDIEKDDAVFTEVISKSAVALEETAKDAKADLAVLAALPPVEQMTMADIYKFLPELNAQSEAEMEANKWEPGLMEAHNLEGVQKLEEDRKAKRVTTKPEFFAATPFWK